MDPTPPPEKSAAEPRQRQSAETRREEAVAAVIELASAHSPKASRPRRSLAHRRDTRRAVPSLSRQGSHLAHRVRLAGYSPGLVADAAIATGGTPLEVLERLFHAQVAFVADHPGVPRILFHELQRPAGSPLQALARNIVGGYRERLKTLIRRAKEAGELPSELDEEAAAVLFVGTVQGLVVQSTLFSGALDMREAAQRIFPLLA
jgi:TetR/AcrR family transcriptional regulator